MHLFVLIKNIKENQILQAFYIFFIMGLFDTTQNIVKTPIKFILSFLPPETAIAGIYRYGMWFYEDIDHNYIQFTPHPKIKVEYSDIYNVWEKFEENFESIQLDMNCNKSIPQQLGEIFKEYIGQNNYTIYIDKLFMAYNNSWKLSKYFTYKYQDYLLRYKFKQKGFEQSPDKIGYIHTSFQHNNIIIHWFCPLVMAESWMN